MLGYTAASGPYNQITMPPAESQTEAEIFSAYIHDKHEFLTYLQN
jgi:hypothetical protein